MCEYRDKLEYVISELKAEFGGKCVSEEVQIAFECMAKSLCEEMGLLFDGVGGFQNLTVYAREPSEIRNITITGKIQYDNEEL